MLGVLGVLGYLWSFSIVLGVSGDMGVSLGSWHARGGEWKLRLNRLIFVGGELGGDNIDMSVVPLFTFTASFSRYLAIALRYFSLYTVDLRALRSSSSLGSLRFPLFAGSWKNPLSVTFWI